MNNYRDISIRGDDGRRDGRSIRGKYKYKGTTDDESIVYNTGMWDLLGGDGELQITEPLRATTRLT